jgi:Kdo-III transferase WaaZ
MMLKRAFQKAAKIVRRWIWRIAHPRQYWHMCRYDGRFGLSWTDGRADVMWRRRVVARTVRPDDVVRNSNSIAIVASGPSLLQTPAAAWTGRDVACVNGSILWASERGVRPRLYVVSDPGFAKRRLDLITLATRQADLVCVTVRCLFELLRQQPDLFATARLLVVDNVNHPYGRTLYQRHQLAGNPHGLLDEVRTYEDRFIGVSTDLGMGIFAGGTVVLAAAQIAIALGYKDIQFLGLDMKTTGSQHRFYQERKPEPSFIDRNFHDLILPSFDILRRYCDKRGVTLSNWSNDSAIPRSLVPAASSDVGLAAE